MSFTFSCSEETQGFDALQPREARDRVAKWNLDAMRCAKFRFDQRFDPEQLDEFLRNFFASDVVQKAAPVTASRDGAPGLLGEVSAVRAERLSTRVLRMDFWDRLKAVDIVHSNGQINKCFDVQCGDILASDRLRVMLLDEGSEDWDAYSTAERSELIFHIMRRLAVGGGLNQYDDTIEPYLELCKGIYKDLVAVHKVASGAVQVRSLAYQIVDVQGAGAPLFPRPSPHNFCYVVVDPLQRNVKLWYNAWFPMM